MIGDFLSKGELGPIMKNIKVKCFTNFLASIMGNPVYLHLKFLTTDSLSFIHKKIIFLKERVNK